ncbi:MAG TPA: GNAT family N-acetyltransferase [Nevskiaceae bacterium]|nr:GNAT family N-acetyltransferase [Nevskiaceae bacterium]
MPDLPTLRRAQLDDVNALLRLEALFPSDALSRRSLRRLLARPSAALWVADLQDRVVGSAVLLTRSTTATGRLYSLVVDPATRGHGIGARLIAQMHHAAYERGKRAMVLEVRPDNAAAIALYTRFGYRSAARLTGYYEDGSDALRMRLMNLETPAA